MTALPSAEYVKSPPAETGIVEILPSRQPEGQGFTFKVPSSGRLYRLDSARDPKMPRFWCFRICRCASAGTIDATERPWYGGDRMNREDLPAALEAICANPNGWLALPQHSDLRAWVFEDRLVEELPTRLTHSALRRVQTR
jgi:hypothetical protein